MLKASRQGSQPSLESIQKKYFPPDIIPGGKKADGADLIAQFPLRYEFLRREQTGISLINGAMRFYEPDHIERLNNLQRYLGAHTGDGEQILRKGQVPVFSSLVSFFEQGLRSGFVVVPTRGGKTVIFVELTETLGLRSLVLVPTKDLVTQTVRDFKKFAPQLDLGVHYGKKKEGLDHQIVVSTYQSWMALVKKGAIKPGDFQVIILDEAHEILSSNKSRLIEPFLESDVVIGFTATDKYSDKKCLMRILNKQIHRMSIKEAIDLQLITPFSVITVETKVDLSQVRTDFSSGDYNRHDLAETLAHSSLTKDAIELYKRHFHKDVGIISCCGVNHAKEVASAFSKAGIPSVSVYGEMDDNKRTKAIEAHQTGEVKILTTAKLLTGGYDNPIASFIFNIDPTMSIKHATQRGGRPLTLNPEDPAKVGTIVEFLHSDDRKRRKQMTFLDSTLCAFYKGSHLKVRVKKIGKANAADSLPGGVRVTTAPEAVEAVIAEHSAGHQSIKRKTDHHTDVINLAVKALHMERQKIIMGFGVATVQMKEAYQTRRQKPIQDCIELIEFGEKEARQRFKNISSKPLDSKRQAQLFADNGEFLAHLERRFRSHGLLITDIIALRQRIGKQRDELDQILNRVGEICKLPTDIAPVDVLRHVDRRCSDHHLSDSALALVKQNAPAQWNSKIRNLLINQIAAIEDDLLVRWDTLHDAMQQIDEIESRLRNFETPLLKATRRMIGEQIKEFRGRSLSDEDLRQEAWSIAIPLIDRYLFEGTRKRFSTYFNSSLRKALTEAVNTADRAALNIVYTEEYRSSLDKIDSEDHDKKLGEHSDLVYHYNSPLSFFSEHDKELPNDGDEITENDFDPETSLQLAVDEIATPLTHIFGKPSAIVNYDSIAALIKKASLNYREREIIKFRYFEGYTLDECVAIFKVTRERIRQIEAKGVRKIQRVANRESEGDSSFEFNE